VTIKTLRATRVSMKIFQTILLRPPLVSISISSHQLVKLAHKIAINANKIYSITLWTASVVSVITSGWITCA